MVDKWPNSHFYQSAYADRAPTIRGMIKLLDSGTTLSSSNTETSVADTAAFTLQPI